MEFLDYGPIKRIVLPDGWEKPAQTESWLVKFCRSDDPEVEVDFFNPGQPVNSFTTSRFRALLGEPPHRLSDKEFAEVGVIIRDQAAKRDFTLAEAYTRVLKGVTVYCVRAHWNPKNLDALSLFIDCGGEIMTTREIHYFAPPDRFGTHLPEFERAIESIEWNPS